MMLRAATSALLPLLALSACGGEDDAPDDSAQPIEVQPIEVQPGADFALELKSNPSTGYRWVLVDSAALGPLRLVGTRYEMPRQSQDRNGAGGTERWIFNATAAGEGVVSLVYVRPWEQQVPKDTTRYRVTVR